MSPSRKKVKCESPYQFLNTHFFKTHEILVSWPVSLQAESISKTSEQLPYLASIPLKPFCIFLDASLRSRHNKQEAGALLNLKLYWGTVSECATVGVSLLLKKIIIIIFIILTGAQLISKRVSLYIGQQGGGSVGICW